MSNGLLLRADLHTLFDLGLVVVDPQSMKVEVAQALQVSFYAGLAGTALRLPHRSEEIPSKEALAAHREWAGF